MAETASVERPNTASDLQALVGEYRTQIFTRVAAGKPLDPLFYLLGFDISEDDDIESPIDPDESAETSGNTAFMSVASAILPNVFGIRVGMKLETQAHLVAAEVAVEYQWTSSVDYSNREAFMEFAKIDAVPKVMTLGRAILIETARGIGFNPTSPFPTADADTLELVGKQLDNALEQGITGL
ncbi:hypothetical protein SEA_JUJU_44 [Gordonia phage JuJu]|uniref:Uncharacterized protein n=1 Tax=Gordonia phage JuJu TaxID=2590929 RepID=A0A516KR42_9CAUD|nr:hypothetical protein KNU69_gp44 [Gordonia phage JuJu]QDP44160.1 hypothetical protein SEA_JUJU_44 [Gordonia phage JuJu]